MYNKSVRKIEKRKGNEVMISERSVEALLGMFMMKVRSSKANSVEEMNDIIDCYAIELATNVSEVAEEMRHFGDEVYSIVSEAFETQMFTLTTVSDAVKQIVAAPEVSDRMHIYHTLMDLLSDTTGTATDFPS